MSHQCPGAPSRLPTVSRLLILADVVPDCADTSTVAPDPNEGGQPGQHKKTAVWGLPRYRPTSCWRLGQMRARLEPQHLLNLVISMVLSFDLKLSSFGPCHWVFPLEMENPPSEAGIQQLSFNDCLNPLSPLPNDPARCWILVLRHPRVPANRQPRCWSQGLPGIELGTLKRVQVNWFVRK